MPQAEQIKFSDPQKTIAGKDRASVHLNKIRTLWVNTGTLCNLSCQNCYIESSPTNDRLEYFANHDLKRFLDELKEKIEIGFTGGEPFLNPEMIDMMRSALSAGHHVLVLTNAMLPLLKTQKSLLQLKQDYPDKIQLRVSLDHFEKEKHESERGPRTFDRAMEGLSWLSQKGFPFSIAARLSLEDNDEQRMRMGFQQLMDSHSIPFDALKPDRLVLFPEMDASLDVPEITTECWEILGKKPDEIMCASSRMLVKRKGDPQVKVMACTLLAYDDEFVMGESLEEAKRVVYLNHPHCSKFCVLGGASCSAT